MTYASRKFRRRKDQKKSSKSRKLSQKVSKSDVTSMLENALSKRVEKKYELIPFVAAGTEWNSGHHAAQIELDLDLSAGTGPSQIVGQDIFLHKLDVCFVLTPGKHEGLLGMSTSDPVSYSVNPFVTPRPMRYAIVLQDRTIAANQAGNFFDILNYKWEPKGLFKQDFNDLNAVQALIRGTKILKRGTFYPKHRNISCTPDGSSASKTRCLSIPLPSMVKCSVEINKKIKLETGTNKNAQRWVYSLYLSDYDGSDETYSPYVDPTSISVRHMFTFSDA